MTISQIAKMAGVSVATVSRYLNDGYVSEEKKKEIKKVIEKTGYVPSKQAQILRTKKTRTIGVVVPKISSESIGRLVAGVSSVLSETDYLMFLTNTENSIEKELNYLSLLNNNPVEGIIFTATILTEQHRKLLKRLNVPVVIVGQQLDGYPCVYHDDYNSSKELTRLMIEAGRTNLACIGVTPKDKAAGAERIRGFQDALAEHKLEISEEMFIESGFSVESGYEKMKTLLETSPNIDGVFCATDGIAIGAMECLKEQGYEIPRDISITGIGYTNISRAVTPKLTVANLHHYTSGVESAKMLLEVLETGEEVKKQIQLGYEIIEAGSI